ncbi:major royal jelly protein 1 [Rhagoletis pomonella]|uniref:major royal jelly protein 1 n=1 Tax=Rhagoletis pomonella TaxID=28610 RepID=UPI00177BD789|nr:major royal jelly protein 1 [Rhagoletis pomonella]
MQLQYAIATATATHHPQHSNTRRLLLLTTTITFIVATLLPTHTLAAYNSDLSDSPADVTESTENDSYAGNSYASNSNKYSNSGSRKCDKNPLAALTFQLSGNNLRWPCESTKNIYVQSGRYVPRNVIVTRAQLQRDDAFVALPRYKQGVPFTLGRVQLKKGECVAKIAPYPCWAIQEEGNCQALQSVVDIVVDANGLLWALDVGLVNTLEQPIRRCGPKIVAINTADNKVVKSIDLSDLVTAESRLQFIVVDYSKDNKPFVYVADAGARSILVYDISDSKSYRIVLPKATAPTTDVLYMALTTSADGTSTLYFTYLSSPRLYSIRGQYLRVGQGAGSIVDVGAKPYGKQMVLLGADGGTNLFFRYKGENDIYMWNSETCFKAANLQDVQHGGDCRLSTQVLPGHKRFMWALESNFHDFISERTGCNGASIVLHPVVRECDD